MFQPLEGYTMSRKNKPDGKVHYSHSPAGRKRGKFLVLDGSLALLTINGKAEVKGVREGAGIVGAPFCQFRRMDAIRLLIWSYQKADFQAVNINPVKSNLIPCLLQGWKNLET